MRPLKHPRLGPAERIRVPAVTMNVLEQLNEIMNRLEENGQDSVEIINGLLEQLEETF